MDTMNLKSRFTAIGCSALLAASVAMPGMAFAAGDPSTADNVTAAATRAAGPAPEILGIDGIEESGQFIYQGGTLNPATSSLSSALITNNWTSPKYYIFGTDYNTVYNRYFANAVSNPQGTPMAKLMTRTGTGNGPNQALSASDQATLTTATSTTPDIVVGTGISSKATTDENAVYSSLGALGVTYAFNNNDEICKVMYDLAAKADSVVADDGKVLRYGDASEIALDYEKYVKGLQGYVLYQLGEQGLDMAEIAHVQAVTYSDADNTIIDTLTLTKTLDNNADGTAPTNRYLEALKTTTTNYANLNDNTAATSVTISYSTLLAAIQSGEIDAVVFGGQNGGIDQSTVAEKLRDMLGSSYRDVVYYVNNNSAGSIYGVVMNSVENAQNIGRLLGFVYEGVLDGVDQSDFVAYYYDKFYHVDGDSLGDVIDGAMDGVTNWNTSSSYDANIKWSSTDVADYDQQAIQDIIETGCAYIEDNIGTVDSSLIPAAGATFEIPADTSNF